MSASTEPNADNDFDDDFEDLARSLEDRYLCQRLDDSIELLGWLHDMLTERMKTSKYKDLDLTKAMRILRKRLVNYQQHEF